MLLSTPPAKSWFSTGSAGMKKLFGIIIIIIIFSLRKFSLKYGYDIFENVYQPQFLPRTRVLLQKVGALLQLIRDTSKSAMSVWKML